MSQVCRAGDGSGGRRRERPLRRNSPSSPRPISPGPMPKGTMTSTFRSPRRLIAALKPEYRAQLRDPFSGNNRAPAPAGPRRACARRRRRACRPADRNPREQLAAGGDPDFLPADAPRARQGWCRALRRWMLIAATCAAHRPGGRGEAEIAVIALADLPAGVAPTDRRRSARQPATAEQQRASDQKRRFIIVASAAAGKACGFCLISCWTSCCRRTSTSWLDVDVEIDLDRLVRRLDRDAAAQRQRRGNAGGQLRHRVACVLSLRASGWWGLWLAAWPALAGVRVCSSFLSCSAPRP